MKKMKAIVIDRFGGPEVLKIRDVALPEPGKGEIQIVVRAAGLNPVDYKVREGKAATGFASLPFIPGYEVAGVVTQLGEGVTDFKIGDDVLGLNAFPNPGRAYAEYVVGYQRDFVPKPGNLPFAQAAALPLAGLTAWQALFEVAEIKMGMHVLIHGASGGVGHLLVQLAAMAGAKVTATTSTSNITFVRGLGASLVVDYTKEAFEQVVKNQDVVIDGAGRPTALRSVTCIKKGGVLVPLPSSTKDDPVLLDLAKERGISVRWLLVHPSREDLLHLVKKAGTGALRVQVSRTFSLNEVQKAHELLAEHHTIGKMVILPTSL